MKLYQYRRLRLLAANLTTIILLFLSTKACCSGLGAAYLQGDDADPGTPVIDLVAGGRATLYLTYTTGSQSIPIGGKLKINYYTQGAPYSGVFQTSNPAGDNYITASASTSSTLSVLGSFEGSISSIIVTILSVPLVEGDTITITIGDKSGGGTGWWVQRNSNKSVLQFFPNNFLVMYPTAFRVLLLAENGTTFKDIDSGRLPVNILPHTAVSIHIVPRSSAAVGEQSRFVIMMPDGFGNCDHLFTGTVTLSCTDPFAILPNTLNFGAAEKGRVILNDVVFNTPGIHRISAFVPNTNISGRSNAVIVTAESPSLRIFWGDLHVHTVVSDGVETQDMMFEYAREISGFDLQATSDHTWETDKTAIMNTETTQQVIAAYQPGIFTTIKGYEWATLTAPVIGHHNVYYRTTEPPALASFDGPFRFWYNFFDEVAKYDAIIIPHHTAKAILDSFYKRWEYHSIKQERLVEIYSTHGNNEYQGNPRAVNMQLAGHNIQDGLILGYKLGLVGGSDSHTTRPGCLATDMIFRPGITAVYAPSNIREDIWDALWNRRCYATTGERIVLDFTINGEMMGSEIPLRQNKPVNIYVHAIGQSNISRIDIIKGHIGDTTPLLSVFTVTPNAEIAEFNWTDSAAPSDCFYYVRVTQANGEMAWSSPIWVSPSFTITDISNDESTGDITITWGSIPYHLYSVFYKDSYDDEWKLAETDIAGNASGTSSWTDDGTHTGTHPSTSPQRLYSVKPDA
jgi:hypothetical protein